MTTITVISAEQVSDDADRARNALARGDYHGGIDALERLIVAARFGVVLASADEPAVAVGAADAGRAA
jgi:hypothetical protein